MKIEQLLSGIGLHLTTEEYEFIKHHGETSVSSLNEHEKWIAQNLVRKGAYSISKDNNTLIKNIK